MHIHVGDLVLIIFIAYGMIYNSQDMTHGVWLMLEIWWLWLTINKWLG